MKHGMNATPDIMIPDIMTPDILCIGSALWDIIGHSPVPMAPGADVPGRIRRLPGGVALNIAMTLARLGLRPALLTHVGQDPEGHQLIAAAEGLGIDCRHVWRSPDLPTDRYMAIEAAGCLVAAIADAHALERAGARILDPLIVGPLGTPDAPWAGLVALDGNLTPDLLARIADEPALRAADLRLAPASPGKADRLLALIGHPRATLYVNLEEAGLLCAARFDHAGDAAAALLARGAGRVLVTAGHAPCADGAPQGIILRDPPAVRVARITGAGDTFMAAHILAERQGAPRATALDAALAAAAHYIAGDPGS